MEIFGKRPFFRADMAGLRKYNVGGYGRIGVHRVKKKKIVLFDFYHRFKWFRIDRGRQNMDVSLTYHLLVDHNNYS